MNHNPRRGARELIRPSPLYANEAEGSCSSSGSGDGTRNGESADENEVTDETFANEGQEAQTPSTMCSPCMPTAK